MTVTTVQSFPSLALPDARVLILGSMPGVASLQAQRYYANPRNAFWPIMAALLKFEVALPYAKRIEQLQINRIALWDVLASCERPGSLDSNITRESERPNDFVGLFQQCQQIRVVACNGGTAFNLFKRHVRPTVNLDGIAVLQMPSTSPAHAARSFDVKLREWSTLRDYLVD